MKIIDNENILIENVNNEVYISFRPYNIELNLNYIVYWTKGIIKEYETFILYCQSYNFDGLNETNNLLLENDFIIYDQYYNAYRTVKKVL